jgi:uncharacterized protein
MYQRSYPNIQKGLQAKHSVLVLGPRGSGKTFYLSRLLKTFAKSRLINLLDSTVFRKYLLEPSLLYDETVKACEQLGGKGTFYLMIDEIQLVSKLFLEVHRCIDELKGRVVFILTGSSARKLKREDVDLLASRALSIKFFPLCCEEINFTREFSSVMRFGTLPEILSSDDEWLRGEKLDAYVGTYLEEEIKKEAQLRSLEGFHRFLEYAASMNGEPVNYSKIGRAAMVSPPTVREYFSVLTDTLIATEIPAWAYSMKKQLQQASKYYFFDNGVLNALTGDANAVLKASNYRFGRLFENLVINEIIRYRFRHSCKVDLSYYRDLRGHEIDLIVQKNPGAKPVAVEIKSAPNPALADVSTLLDFKKDNPSAECVVLCRADQPYSREKIRFEPFISGIKLVFELALEKS